MQVPGLYHIPKRAEHGVCRTHGTSAWQVIQTCIVQMWNIEKGTSSLEIPTFPPPVLQVLLLCWDRRSEDPSTLLWFIYLLLFPFLAAFVLAIRNIPATCKSKGAESCSTKQHSAESNASSGS